MKGTVNWYDISSGEGEVFGQDGLSYYLHYSCIEPNTVITSYGERAVVVAGQEVEFTLYRNLYSVRVERLGAIRK